MKVISAEEMRGLDARMIQEYNVPSEELMELAGEGLAASIRRLAAHHQLVDSPVLFVAGAGNNGGDAFVAAHGLYVEDEWPVEVWLTVPENRLKGDALLFFKKMKKAGVSYRVLADARDWVEVAACGNDAEIVVDGVLGTGIQGEPRGAAAEAIAFIQACSQRALVVAIDVPSAMQVCADLTVTMGLPKSDFVQPEYVNVVGNLDVIDLGFPDELLDAVQGDTEVELLHAEDVVPLFPRRPRDTHKGDYGHLACLGGSKGFSGAITMAAQAAMRSGVGLVSVEVPEEIYAVTAPVMPEVMVHTELPEHPFGAYLLGPGMGRSAQTRETVLQSLQESKAPVVLDADALSVLAGHTQALVDAVCPVVLTPHPGELATLLGVKTEEVQEDRFAMAKMAAENLNAVVVLKGAGTVVAMPNAPLAVNLTGNPGMATGGSGDVLAGLLAGFVAQGLPPYGAACAAVWLHGRAGDLVAAEKAQASLVALDLLEKLPEAIREVSGR